MSYRNPNQALAEPILDISAGIDKFTDAVLNRVKSDEWEYAHIVELTYLCNELRSLQARLLILERDTW